MENKYHTSQDNPDAAVLLIASRVLLDGGVAVVPTDSVYGIGCAVLEGNPAYERIYDVKKRPHTMKLPWLIADRSQLNLYAKDIPTWAEALADELWPGALTLVVKASEKVPEEYKAEDGTIALRMPNSNFVRSLIRQMGTPLAATSANVHGKPSAVSGDDIDSDVASLVDIVIDAGFAPVAVESTIVDCTQETPQIVRLGALSAPTIEVIYSERSN